MDSSDSLSRRLLRLRQNHWGEQLTQPALGRMLGVKAPTISSWERAEAVPPQERIEAYATFFASRRSLAADRLLEQSELTDGEQAMRTGLLAELTDLRDRAQTGDPITEVDPLVFGDGAPIRIICGKLEEPPATASGTRWNYMALSAFADLDALVALHGHLREVNPGTDVRYKLAQRMEGHDLRAHLVILGHLAMSQTDLRDLLPPALVRQVADPATAPDGEIFEVPGTGARFGPTFAGTGEDKRVVEDVGLLARMPNPIDTARTLTVLSGVYTRGVYGAVRCLTDREVGPTNGRWLREHFGRARAYGVLMKVSMAGHAISAPRLGDADVCLHTFSEIGSDRT